MNQITVSGNLKANPRESVLPSGTIASNFDLAVDREWTDPNGNRQKHTTWFRIEVLNGQAGPCNQYLHKGRKVLVQGHLVTDEHGNCRIWTDQNGNPRATLTIRAHFVEFMDSPRAGAEGGQQRETPQEVADNIPF